MENFNGMPFQYNPAITNVNIDNQLAGILSQFNDDYIMDVIKDSLDGKLRVYTLPRPNIVTAFESTFKESLDGFSSNTDEIINTRKRVYTNIIGLICKYYNFTFIESDETDLYSVAFWLYDFFVSNFTVNMRNFYVGYLIREKDGICSALDLLNKRKDNDPILGYSKRLFKDPKLAAIHCDIDYVIDQISTFDIDLWTILTCAYSGNVNLPSYIFGSIKDNGNFFNNYYEKAIATAPEAADILIDIKLSLQQAGGELEPLDIK